MTSQNHNIDNEASHFFEIELSEEQLDNILQVLPKGFFLEKAIEYPTLTPQSSKKHSTHEVNRSLDHDLDTVSNSDLKASTNKRALRDHNKKKMQEHLEQRFNVFETQPTTSSKSFKPANEGVRKCYNVLQRLKKHPDAGPFLEPVDVVGLGLSDYHSVIREPMDISTIENKLKNGDYTTVNQLAVDMRKIWSNAIRYNGKAAEVSSMANEMSAYFEKMYKEIENVSLKDSVKDLEMKVEKLSRQISDLHNKNGKYHPAAGLKQNKAGPPAEKGLTLQEKKVLCQGIKQLSPEHLRGVWEIVSEGLGLTANQKEILEFDIDSLPVRVARELEKYLKLKLGSANKSKNKKAKETVPVPVHKVIKPAAGAPFQHSKLIPNNNNNQQDEYHQPAGNMQAQRNDDAESRSSESSFLSDSDSDTEKEISHKKLIV